MKENFIAELKINENFMKKEKLDEALKETFIKMDTMMITKEGIKKLCNLKDPSRAEMTTDYDLSSIYAGCTANVALIYKN